MTAFPLSTFFHRLHRDQRGAISLLSVFGIFLFTILLGQVMNIGRQIDDKLRMQNAADAAAYSGGVSIARGMNAIAFSNHILCETFALTAYMREARDRHSDQFIPPVLAAWQAVGERYRDWPGWDRREPKFPGIGRAIVNKVPIEQQMVDQFSEMAYRQSRMTLPAFEYLLQGVEGNPQDPRGGFIPRFQRAVRDTTPVLALATTDDIARRYGQSSQSLHRGEPLRAFLWKSNVENVEVVGMTTELDPMTRVIPVIDPSRTDENPDRSVPLADVYYCLSSFERDRLSHHYLWTWISHWQGPYFEWDGSGPRGHETAKMSNYINFFRIFACGQLNRLLNEEYPDTNLPLVHRELWRAPEERCGYIHPLPDPERFLYRNLQQENESLEGDYNFVATAFWPQMTTMMPGLYQNPLHRGQRTYAATFAQAEVYIPRARYIQRGGQWGQWVPRVDQSTGLTELIFIPYRDPWLHHWHIINQNWTVRLIPATASALPQILTTHPQTIVPGVLTNYQAPQLGASEAAFNRVNGH